MTAIAAAEKKKKKDEMYFRFNTSRGMGYVKTRNRDFENAASLFTTAIENAEPGMEIPLYLARSKVQSRLVNHDEARRDAMEAIKRAPVAIRCLENDAYTLYEKDDFEDALVRHYCGLRLRKKPDYFYKGILVGKETLEDCIGRNAGPCLDHERLGQVIVDMYRNPRCESHDTNDFMAAKRKFEKARSDRFFAQKYLGRLAADKKFITECLHHPDLKSGNKEHNEKLEALLTHMLEVINRQQETLQTQRPLYMLEHHKPKFSQKYQEQKKIVDKNWRDGVMAIIQKLIDDGNTLEKEKNIRQCVDICDRLRRFVECQPSSILSDNKREKVLDKLYTIYGTLFMGTKTFVDDWTDIDNERRIELILRSRVDDPRFVARVEPTYFPKIWNVKEMRRNLESRLSVSIHKMERMYLYHELSRCLFEIGSTEKAYKAASTGFRMAKEFKDIVWSFNNGFLAAMAVLIEGNADDAKIGLTEVMINARRLERDDCAVFIQKVIKTVKESDRLNFDPPDATEKRKNDILSIMPNPELKAKAYTAMQKVTRARTQARLPLQTSSAFKGRASGSRRSMKVTARAKRRTLYDVKGARNQHRQSLQDGAS